MELRTLCTQIDNWPKVQVECGATNTGVDSVGLIRCAQAGIGFHPRMGGRWAYLELCTPRSQSPKKDLLSVPVTVRVSMVSEGIVR